MNAAKTATRLARSLWLTIRLSELRGLSDDVMIEFRRARSFLRHCESS